jgi:Cobalamin synthesis protein cobW C-terminal domain
MFEGTPDREWQAGEERVNKMVFIGKYLDMELLKEGFEDCLHVEGEDPMIVPEDAEAVASASC